ncbi:hypothetical protein BRE01_00980 [Brevibacillus reuszeri]|uniref:Uncharacterized protein n=1 Tax=Brevibacillus reuszeri TaxID=54915 RepID=A0A0K9YRI4_9BACL|nr:hypothetical protein [Brevibacillus reuszeri]KNB71329.1 hypothetical protein ADS79_21220 [Brevibacillus reuszeri]MED1857774.1 hypothetical protein [Brevibacillus reuszeri]GED66396.1 hypothetical protein BRE01_00980 [Brevibacillus reuszeri]
MGVNKETDSVLAAQLDVYETTRVALNDLIAELCEALEEEDTDPYTRKGYEMIGHYYRTPVHTGELTLVFASVLADILHKLELTQQGEDVSMVRDQYSVMKKDE